MWGRFLTWFITGFLAKHFPARYRVIPRRSDGVPLLRQFKIFDWLYLQSFLNPEEKDLFHIHRWRRMYSVVLSGCFWEERYPGAESGGPNYELDDDGCFSVNFFKRHKAPSAYSMDWSDIHRLNAVLPDTWTLFFMFGNEKEWGYYPRPYDAEYIPWDIAIPDDKKVKSL